MDRGVSAQASMAKGGRLLGLALVAAVLLLGVVPWRLSGQHVNLVVVNESTTAVEFTWQPTHFAAMASVTRNACESSSMDLEAGLDWRLTGDDGTVILDSSAVSVPFFTPRVAVEVRLDARGDVHIVPGHEVAEALDAPYPECVSETAAQD